MGNHNQLRASLIRKVNVNIADVNDLDRGFSAGRWSRCVDWLRRRKVNGVFGHIWMVAESKYGGAEEGCGGGGDIHVAEVVGEYGPFAGNGTLTDIFVFNL